MGAGDVSAEEPRYTAAEWRRREVLRACAAHGHEHQHLDSGDGTLLAVWCDRCGKRWDVTEVSR
jgi:hypothetical protein